LVEHGFTSLPTQYRFRSEDPTNSNTTEGKSYKGKPEKGKKHKIHIYNYTYKIADNKRYTYKAQQVP